MFLLMTISILSLMMWLVFLEVLKRGRNGYEVSATQGAFVLLKRRGLKKYSKMSIPLLYFPKQQRSSREEGGRRMNKQAKVICK